MAEITPEGLTSLTQAEIQALIEADLRAEISDSLDLSTSSLIGQLDRNFARHLALHEEALAALVAAFDPDSATGAALLAIAALRGTVREAASPSRVAVVCTLAAGTYAAGALAAAPAGRPEDRFVSAEEVVTAGGDVSVVFEAEETGPIQVAADTLEIASPVVGWSAIVSHPDATPGEDIETEAALRRRSEEEITAPGSSSAAGIRADLTREISEIESCTVVENDTDATVDSIPPHAVEAIVYGPDPATDDDDDAVAEQILASKAGGIGTYGTTSRTVYDAQGVAHVIRFTRPASVTVPIVIGLAVDPLTYVGDAEIATLIAAGAAALLPGRDVSWSNVAAWVMGAAGVLRITSLTVSGVSMGTTTITSRQIASILAGDVTVTSAEATP